MTAPPPASPPLPERVFLVIVDESDELKLALRYAARRAQHTGGRVALLFVIEPSDPQQWVGGGTLMREGGRGGGGGPLQKVRAGGAAGVGWVAGFFLPRGRGGGGH